MKRHLFRTLAGLLILLLLLGHAAKIYSFDMVSRLDAILYDARLRLTMPNTKDDRVIILDIDEKSLMEIGRWPWNRERMSALLDTLFDHYGVRVLGFDVVFAEPDDSSGLKSLQSLAGKELKKEAGFQAALGHLKPRLDYDARFSRALKGRPVILGYYMLSKSDWPSSGAIPPPVLPGAALAGGDAAIPHWQTYGGNLPQFQHHAAGGGHFNPLVDFDGIVRRVPMLVEYQGGYYESLSLAVLRAYLGFPEVVPGFPAGAGASDLEWLDLEAPRGLLRVPVDEGAAALIPYRGKEGSFIYYSLADVLAGRVPVEQLRGRIALVGATAAGLKDLRATPVGEVFPGVEVHANLISGMLEGRLMSKPSYAVAIDLLLLLVTGGLMVFLLPRLTPARATLFSLVLLVALVATNLAFWQYAHFVLPLAAGLILVMTLFGLNMTWGYYFESRSKRQMTGLFGQYLPPELVEEMSRDPENYSMAGRKEELTVLFSDVRGFTTISEGLGPDELAAMMNEYLGAMTQVIRDQRGTLDKYIGDAIMAFWGAPVANPMHARHAVTAALEMLAALPELNQRLATRGWPALKIGIGINTGAMTVGDMGSSVRQAYTVMGDAVNLGSRLEGITKQYGVCTLVGENTYAQVKADFLFREIDRVRVKGKAEPVGIYEPLCAMQEAAPALVSEVELWNLTLMAYRAQDWAVAEKNLARLLEMTEQSPYFYELYMKRIEHYRAEPPGEDWDGVTTFETK